MKRKYIILAVVGLLLIVLYRSTVGSYNNLVVKEEGVSAQWSQVENVYQRRADLIPNLVEVVKGYASHEKETLEGVIEARAKATSTAINVKDLSAESLQQFQSAQQGLTSALQKLMVVVERYPDLKANQNFLELQAQLEGSENRITVERKKFNDAAQEFNSYRRVFPKNAIASLFGFEAKDYFKADEGANKAPEVKF
jgi:LemA protein